MAKTTLHLIAEVRRTKLVDWYSSTGRKQTDIARDMGLENPSMINQHLRGKKAIGEVWARRYEEYMRVPGGYLDGHSEGAKAAIRSKGEFEGHDAIAIDAGQVNAVGVRCEQTYHAITALHDLCDQAKLLTRSMS